MNLIDKLNAIDGCKEGIKTALVNKGVDMDGVAFSEYAAKIDALQLESGDAPAPTPSADYIYCNGNKNGGVESDIITFTPFEIELDGNGQFIIEVISPEEIPGYEGGTYYDIILTVDVPTTYKISNFELYNDILGYVPQAYKVNPRYSTVDRDGVTYNSYVRAVSDNNDIGSTDVQYEPLLYRITIERK